ncbi:MAG: hypothetical protein A2V98_07135 [Planctomycetes bacterium RBG_16_64_12]|nr:MAG: hypothetical protein A2V98_07135 [Planctomycetes bacterium RBG_16_64_12]
MKSYIDRVDVVHGDRVIASHRRSYQSGDQVLDPLHYLATLGRRPAALDHSNVYRAAGSCPRRLGNSESVSRGVTALGRACGSTSACFNCWPSIRSSKFSR